MTTRLLFATVEVTSQVFYRSSLSYAVVNLKPIVPGHVLVIPNRVVTRLTDLTEPELSCLMRSVQTVGRVIERAYGADGLTIACQDGKAAGQSMPHVHFHLLPRKLQGDRFADRNDEIYPELENAEGDIPKEYLRHKLEGASQVEPQPLKVDADEDRRPRTTEEMVKEANWLKTFFEGQTV
ncbi:hypothetical protein HGRIS_008375 [Hohenbuehelia grisea]|uniref:Bis(5'-adenosyl)-triphosphatase n=1 Tax=Hohenbuehelia grisea TaxID=104357 RepID=A0ABR3J7T0_9AGAR